MPASFYAPSLENKATALRVELKVVQNQRADAQQQLADAESQVERLANEAWEATNVTSEIGSLRAELHEMNSRLARSRSDGVAAQRAKVNCVAELKSELLRSKEDTSKFESMQCDLHKDLTNKMKKQTAVTRRIATLKKELIPLEEQRQSALRARIPPQKEAEDLQALNSETNDVLKAAAEVEADVETALQSIDTLNAEMMDLRACKLEKQTVAVLRNERHAKVKLSQLLEELNVAQEKLKELTHERDTSVDLAILPRRLALTAVTLAALLVLASMLAQ